MGKIKHFIKGLMSNSNSDDDWCVANAEKLRDADLRSFSIPRLEQRKSLTVGASAKILIESKSKRGPITGERPWVVVTEILGASYKVKIDNNLVVFPALNDREIEIGPENILSVILPDEYRLPYGKTCFVSRAVWERDQWPAYASRNKAEDQEGQSGWRVFGEGESPLDAQISVPSELLMSKFQVLDTILDEPNTSDWSWSIKDSEYQHKTKN